MVSPYAELIDLQTEVLRLALDAAAGSELRRRLCEAAAWFPSVAASDVMAFDPRGGIGRDVLVDLLRRINLMREDGGDPLRSLRQMRDHVEHAIDIFDLAPE